MLFFCAETPARKIQRRTARLTLCVHLSGKSIRQSPREELYWCMRDKGVLEKYIRLVKGMYHQCETVVRCAAGTSEPFGVEVGLHQGSAFNPFLFAIMMNSLT